MRSKREAYLDSRQRDLTQYAGMIGEEFRSRIDQLSKIIGDVHEPSIGNYRETLLRKCLQDYLPKRYAVGTGFVAFSSESERSKTADENVDILNLKSYHVSSQIDVIVFDDIEYAPIFRSGDFVVVKPEAVKAIIEVKGSLKATDINDAIEKFSNFGKSWVQYKAYRDDTAMQLPALLLMAWGVYVNRDGRPACNGKILRESIVRNYQRLLMASDLDPNKFPLLSAAYIYDDCAVQLTGITGDGPFRYAYSTERGKHVRYLEDNKTVLDRDSTIANLLAAILVHLAVPFNPDFAYYDQSITRSVHPHEFAGTTDLLHVNS